MSDEKSVQDDDAGADAAPESSRWADIIIGLSAFAVFLVAWEVVVRLLRVPEIILPAPTSIVTALIAIVSSGAVFPHLAITLTEILLGFTIGATVAISLGALIAQFKLVDQLVTPYVVALQAVPKVAIAPLLVIWFGFGISSKVLMTAVIAFFPILVNTVAGLRSVEQDRIDLMTTLRASRWQVFTMVRLPTALPFIFAGLDVGIVLSVIGAIVGEFVGATGGLGHLLLVYNADLKIAAVFALLVILAMIGLLLHAAVGFAQRRVMFWADGTDRTQPR